MTKEGALPSEVCAEVRRLVFAPEGFMRITQATSLSGDAQRTSLRPVALKNGLVMQLERQRGGQVTVANLDAAAFTEALETMLAQPGVSELHVQTATGDLHIRVTRKNRVLIARSKPLRRAAPAPLPHDRIKQQPLHKFDSIPLLKALGIAADTGAIKATMRGKYDQVNAFLRIVEAMLVGDATPTLDVVDCGCGKAYLTFALYFYLTLAQRRKVRVWGIDRNVSLVTKAQHLARELGVADTVRFCAGELANLKLDTQPHLTISLHACDTATDEALAQAIAWRSRYILCAPCCQHELNKKLAGGGALRGLLRYGILRERLADLLTDTFRAQLLRIMGYRVQVLEFVTPEATAKNILLRAVSGAASQQPKAVAEYAALRDFWGITPWLESRLTATQAHPADAG